MIARATSRERRLGIAGAVLAVAALGLALVWSREALTGWLCAAFAVAAIPAGALLFQMMMRLIPGAWGEELRLTCEAGALLAPLGAVAFVPVLVGAGVIYPWASRAPISAFQGAWMGVVPFGLRTVLWFAFLFLAARWLRARRSTVKVAAAGLVVFPILGSLVGVDWLMSLSHDFASSGFGLQMLIAMALIAFAALLLLRLSVGRPPARPGVLGGLLLTLLLLWAYLQFLPFFIIWSSNLPSSVRWFDVRHGLGPDAAEWVFGLLGGIPALLLLFARCRNDPGWLSWLAASVLLGKLVEIGWFALPEAGALSVLAYALALAGLGALAAAGLPLALRHRVAARSPEEARA